MKINETLVRKVLEVVDAGLTRGLGTPIPGQMCVEAAVNYAMGAPHGDEPSCVAPLLRGLKIALNDHSWSSEMARAKGMRRLAIAQLGSAGTLDEFEFASRIERAVIQTQVPMALRSAASLCIFSNQLKLLETANLCEWDPIRDNAIAARQVAYYVSLNVLPSAFYVVQAAVEAAAFAVEILPVSIKYAAHAVAHAAAAVTYADQSTPRDKVFADFAESIVQILVDMKAPGCQWLFLTEE